MPDTMRNQPPRHNSLHVAVIGAGAGGLVAARELRQEGHTVVIYEQQNRVGGTWIYDDKTETLDQVGLNPARKRVHTSLYKSLRTNLPREIMGFKDFPFLARDEVGRDPRRFPGHEEVLLFLEEFAKEFGVSELVRFECQVESVRLVKEEEGKNTTSKWRVRSREKHGSGDLADEVFDAVVVCCGHYTEPRVAEIKGIEEWPGKQIHSHNYRVPEPFQDQVVLIIGGSASAVDISRDIAVVAKEVHVASRSEEGTLGKQPGYDNMWLHPMVESAHEDGTLVFQDGNKVLAQVILYCTGYKYHFPFLETNGIVQVDDNRVGPLYKHVFPPQLAPSLSFIGLPWKVIPFPMSELQSNWIAGVLSGRIALPSQEEMMEDIKGFYSALDAAGMPKRYTHDLSRTQFEYHDWLAAECGLPVIERWRKEMFVACVKNRRVRLETYRDEWDDQHLVVDALEDFKKYIIS